MPREAELRLLHDAELWHGPFTRWEAREAGVPDSRVDWQIASGAWVRVQPNVFRAAGTPVTWWLSAAAVIKAVTDPDTNPRGRVAALSFHSAARALGFERSTRDHPLEITVTGSALPQLWDVTVHRTRRLEGCDITSAREVACTTAARMAVDLAGELDERVEIVELCDDLIGSKLACGESSRSSNAFRQLAGLGGFAHGRPPHAGTSVRRRARHGPAPRGAISSRRASNCPLTRLSLSAIRTGGM